MARISVFSNPLLLGFDEVERMLERASRSSGDGYPPYNIEKFTDPAVNGEVLRITLAVAGFRREDLDISIEESEMIIRGRQEKEEGRDYLHRGIATRQFQRTFVLADGMEVTGANLADGLLSIDLKRTEPERVVRTIEINNR